MDLSIRGGGGGETPKKHIFEAILICIDLYSKKRPELYMLAKFFFLTPSIS